ncbi:hypothetical protein ACHAXH_000191, partial [Discostella pseudostelligera]
MTPTPIIPHFNKFALLADNDEPEEHTNDNQMAILDSGATGHFLTPNAPVQDKQRTSDPLCITMPDGRIISSTHTCTLDLPHLPNNVRAAHIVPGLAHTSLLSARVFCDAGYNVAYSRQNCTVSDKQNNIVLRGHRDPHTNLWRLPLTTKSPTPTATTNNTTVHQQHSANHVHTITHIQNRVKYMHQALFCPPRQTLLRAIHLGFLDGLPFMDAATVHRHLEQSPATVKGRMRFNPSGHRSTRRATTTNLRTHSTTNLFCYAALADKQNGTFYTDCTGALPNRSIDGHQYFFVAYDYDTNYIFAIPITTTSNEAILDAFTTVFDRLVAHGYNPTLNVTDNQASTVLKQFMHSRHCDIQFVEPHNHRVNAAKRAIQTFKNHFISGLCITDKQFPFHLWSHLGLQAEITCNLLRRSRIDPTISAYHQLHNKPYDWNFNPLAPPGTRAIIYNPPQLRTSWGPRGIDAWYCGPSLDHYRGCKFYIPETRGFRISATYQLFPTHCKLPTLSPMEHIKEVIAELKRCLHNKASRKTLINDVLRDHEDPNIFDPNTLPWPPSKGEQSTSKGDTIDTPHHNGAGSLTRRMHAQRTLHPQSLLPTLPNNTTPQENPSLRTSPPPVTLTNLRRSPRIALLQPRTYAHAVTAITHIESQDQVHDHFCAPVTHPVTGESITSYNKLMRDPTLAPVWTRAFGKEFGNLAQGDDLTQTPGTNA